MQCPKCKSSIKDNSLRCPVCNLKVKIVCPECKTINLMGKKKCKACGYEFFKKCPNCGTINIANTDFCRKCGDSLYVSVPSEEQQISVQNLIPENQSPTNEPVIEKTEPIQEIKVDEPVHMQITNESLETDNIEQMPQEMFIDNLEQSEPQEIFVDNLIDEQQPVFEKEQDVVFADNFEDVSVNELNEIPNEIPNEEQNEEQNENIGELEFNENIQTEDGFMVSSDNIDMTEDQLKSLYETIEEIDKSKEKKIEAEALISQKFEKQENLSAENETVIPPEYSQLDQKEAQTSIIEAVQNPLKRIISLNGKEGTGKTLILRYVREALRQENYIWAWGECNALTQITPFGYIQDVLLNLFNLSNFCVNVEDFIKNNTKALEAQFFNLNLKEINDLLNFLYPSKTADFNGILKRKEYTISIIKKVFENMAIKSLIIFVVDDFENIDGASFDFLKNLMEDEKFNERIKILLTNKYNKIAQGYFYSKNLSYNNYSNIFLSGLDKEQCVILINSLYGMNVNLPNSIMAQIEDNSKGTSSYIEQACLILNEIGAIKENTEGVIEFNHEFDDYILPNSTYRIIEERMSLLEKNNDILVKALYYACLLGNKFCVHQYENVLQFLNITKDDFQQICKYLSSSNYLMPMSENYLMFNNTSVWHYIYERAKTEENYVEYNNNIYTCVKDLTLSNNSLKPLLLQNAENKREAYSYWVKNVELASYLGDTNLYVISLKQQLKIANEVTDVLSAPERISILERMGKILYLLSPKEALNYLSASIAYYKETDNYNPVKIIELSAFLTKTCKKLGDYLGMIETCDVVLNALPEGQYTIEKALINSKKLDALIHIGNCEEVINISKSELIDTMESALAKTGASNIVSDANIFEAWMETCLNLAEAYAIQGNIRALDVLSKVNDAIAVNKIEDKSYIQKVLITKALIFTMKGEIKSSAEALTQITSKYSTEEMSEEFVLKWNFINILNKIISRDFQNIADEMFQVTTFADNINDDYTKNMLKLLLGYIIQSKMKNSNKSIEIYNEEIVYFSKEKIATGAILCWLLIARASLNTRGADFSLDIALKALDVAKGPKVSNYIFIIALKQLIAEIYIMKRDFEAANMYLEKAFVIAQQNDLKFMQMLLYHSFAKYNAELVNINQENESDFVVNTVEMYKKAITLSQMLMLNEYESLIVKDFTAFKVSCQLKNIAVIE